MEQLSIIHLLLEIVRNGKLIPSQKTNTLKIVLNQNGKLIPSQKNIKISITRKYSITNNIVAKYLLQERISSQITLCHSTREHSITKHYTLAAMKRQPPYQLHLN